ncbi:hypothetical protein N7497_003841, partial [Penicillium chrysogenum]
QPKGLQQTRSDIDLCKVPAPVCGKPLRATREYLKTAKLPEACFQCFASEGLPDKVRFQMYHDPGCVTRHFGAIHLKEEPLKCNWCEVGLLHRMTFQRHASDVHRAGHESSKPLTRYPFTSNLEWNRIYRIQREYRPEKFHTNPAREENEQEQRENEAVDSICQQKYPLEFSIRFVLRIFSALGSAFFVRATEIWTQRFVSVGNSTRHI